MNFVEFNECVRKLEGGCWLPTMFEDLQVQYCEERLYALRCKHGTPNEHICLIREKSEDAAISRAVFDLHKADKNTSVTVRTDKRNALAELAEDFDMFLATMNCCVDGKDETMLNKIKRIIAELAKLQDEEAALFSMENITADEARRVVRQREGNCILKCRAIAKEGGVK